MIYIGADHRGFELKEKLKTYLDKAGFAYEDLGAFEIDPDDDFVDFASAVAGKVAQDPESNKGILMCRNAVGMDVTANKVKHIRSVLGFDVEQVRLARNDDDANIVALPSGFVSEQKAQEIVEAFLNTPFEGHERQKRRLAKISKLES